MKWGPSRTLLFPGLWRYLSVVIINVPVRIHLEGLREFAKFSSFSAGNSEEQMRL